MVLSIRLSVCSFICRLRNLLSQSLRGSTWRRAGTSFIVSYLCGVYIENFLRKQLVKKILKIGPHLPKLLSNIKEYTFLRHTIAVYTQATHLKLQKSQKGDITHQHIA